MPSPLMPIGPLKKVRHLVSLDSLVGSSKFKRKTDELKLVFRFASRAKMDLFWDTLLVTAVVGSLLAMAFAATFEYIAFRDQNEKKDGSK